MGTEHEEALGVMFRSGGLRHLQGLVLKSSNSIKVKLLHLLYFRYKSYFSLIEMGIYIVVGRTLGILSKQSWIT